MRKVSLLLLLIPLWFACEARAQNFNTLPPLCTVATLGTCAPAVEGVRARVLDGDSETDCTIGSGSTEVVCVYDGSAWGAGGGFGTPTEGESIVNTTDGTFDFTRDEAGTVILTASDDDATAAMTVLPGGAAALVLGGTTTTTATIDTDGADLSVDTLAGNTVSISNSVTGSVILDFRDYADTTDDDMAHALISSNCTTATTGAEECDLNMNITTAGAAVEVVAIDPAGGIEFGDATTTAITLTTDGGSVTLDGTVVAPVPLVSLASGALTINTVHLATATADYDLPDSCDSATGNWVTVVVSDVSETISIGLTDTSDVIQVGDLALDADDELDSPTADTESHGSSITLTCLATNTWFSTAIVGTWVDGGAAD